MAKKQTSENDPKEVQNEGITAISVQGFKSLAKESRIEIRPLTILAGANSSGKSSIMQPLLLMKQTLEASYDPGPLLLDGPNAKFTSANQFISRLQKDSKRQTFRIEMENIEPDLTIKNVFSMEKNQAIAIQEMTIKKDGNHLQLKSNQSSSSLKRTVSEFLSDSEFLSEKIGDSEDLKLEIVRNRCFLHVGYKFLDNKRDFKRDFSSPQFHASIITKIFSDRLNRRLRDVIHVPGSRGNPERVYSRTASGPDFPGIFNNYVATIIAQWEKEKDRRLHDIETMLLDLGLTWKISAKAVDDTQIELQVGRLSQPEPTEDLVNIADVGFGVSQVLPVLVALLVAEEAQLVYLEQPELHLHPRAQYELVKILVETAKRGVKLIVETHSALLLRRVQTLMAEGNLAPNLVKLHWFSRNSEDGMTSIQSADLDEIGAFGDWPEDFGDVELMAESAYLDAVEERSKR